MRNISAQLLLVILIALSLLSCTNNGKRELNPANEIKEARGFELYREGDCWVIKVISPVDSTQDLGVYIFPDKEDSNNIPDIEGATIFPPSRRNRIMLFTSVYSSALRELGAADIIKVVGDSEYITDPYVKEGLHNGNIIDAGMQQEPIAERIIAAKPDMILISHYDGMDPSKLEKLGVPLVYLRESSEQSPLGRAEWIKLLGVIAGKKDSADAIYNKVCAEYKSLCTKANEQTQTKPLVMTETMYQGSWFVPGGKSYASKMIEDAGGHYIWDDDMSTGSLQQSFEAVLGRGANADVWLIKMFDEDLSLASLKNKDARYMLFNPTKQGGVWSVNTAAVPFYDETPFHPELLLHDYVMIFHPTLMPNSSPRYFRQVR